MTDGDRSKKSKFYEAGQLSKYGLILEARGVSQMERREGQKRKRQQKCVSRAAAEQLTATLIRHIGFIQKSLSRRGGGNGSGPGRASHCHAGTTDTTHKFGHHIGVITPMARRVVSGVPKY